MEAVGHGLGGVARAASVAPGEAVVQVAAGAVVGPAVVAPVAVQTDLPVAVQAVIATRVGVDSATKEAATASGTTEAVDVGAVGRRAMATVVEGQVT